MITCCPTSTASSFSLTASLRVPTCASASLTLSRPASPKGTVNPSSRPRKTSRASSVSPSVSSANTTARSTRSRSRACSALTVRSARARPVRALATPSASTSTSSSRTRTSRSPRAPSNRGRSRSTNGRARNCTASQRQEEIPMDAPFSELTRPQQRAIVEGKGKWTGVRGFFEWMETKKYKLHVRVFLSKYRGYTRCPDCGGGRLRQEARDVRVGGRDAAGSLRAFDQGCHALLRPARSDAGADGHRRQGAPRDSPPPEVSR